MPIVDLKCPNCGAVLSVNDGNKSISCPNCGSTFFIESEINQTTIHNTNNYVNGENISFGKESEKERLEKSITFRLRAIHSGNGSNELSEILRKDIKTYITQYPFLSFGYQSKLDYLGVEIKNNIERLSKINRVSEREINNSVEVYKKCFDNKASLLASYQSCEDKGDIGILEKNIEDDLAIFKQLIADKNEELINRNKEIEELNNQIKLIESQIDKQITHLRRLRKGAIVLAFLSATLLCCPYTLMFSTDEKLATLGIFLAVLLGIIIVMSIVFIFYAYVNADGGKKNAKLRGELLELYKKVNN